MYLYFLILFWYPSFSFRQVNFNKFSLHRNYIENYFEKLKKMSLKHLEAGSKCPKIDNGVLRLYSMKYCPYAQRSRLVLLAKNIPYSF